MGLMCSCDGTAVGALCHASPQGLPDESSPTIELRLVRGSVGKLDREPAVVLHVAPEHDV